jgi:hypothetical protein
VRHLPATLPPTFDIQKSNHGATKIEYSLEVKVKRPGMFQRNISIRRGLPVMTLEPPISVMLATSARCASSQTLYVDKKPLMALTLRIPSPAILYSGETLLFQLSVLRFRPSDESFIPIVLQSLTVVLQSRTMLTSDQGTTFWTSPTEILKLTGMKMSLANAFDEEEMLDLCSLRTITMPKVTPSFTTCTVKRDYVLEVNSGITIGLHDEPKV